MSVDEHIWKLREKVDQHQDSVLIIPDIVIILGEIQSEIRAIKARLVELEIGNDREG